RRRGAIFVLPSVTVGQRGPVAPWLSTAGWASATERVLGRAWIVTPEGAHDADALRARASGRTTTMNGSREWAQRTPVVVKTAMKDAREWTRARHFTVAPDGPWSESSVDVEFVWQRHELFHQAGVRLAAALHRPLVLFVPA